MEDYKKAYFSLFNKLTDVIEELKEIQCQAEEMLITDCPENKDQEM